MDPAAQHADPAFPQVHPRPARGWTNDPNGLGYADGRFHVSFRYNPDSARHVAAEVPPDPLVTAVRDPFLFNFHGRRFALQGAAGWPPAHAAVQLYSADDIGRWKYEGIWFSTEDPRAVEHLPAELRECPQLVRVPDSSGADTWILMASLWLRTDQHEHPNGVGYLLDSLVPDAAGLPVFAPAAGGKADLCREFYAPQILALPDRALRWGWSGEAAGSEGRRTQPGGVGRCRLGRDPDLAPAAFRPRRRPRGRARPGCLGTPATGASLGSPVQ
ncbi:MAG: hypothetical protein ABWX69_00655 [Arthrobacter sp.]